MPNLQHNADKERHLTLAALAHCPRHYQYVDETRRGSRTDQAPSSSLMVGLLAHVGLRNLWTQRAEGKLWIPSKALDAMDTSPEGAVAALSMLKDGAAAYMALKRGIVEYAAQWVGVRDDWKPIVVAPEEVPPLPWTVVGERFVAYPDLIVETKTEPVRVVDHKTSAWRFESDKWEWHPELLTQCLAAQQLKPGEPVYYQIDYLQRPAPRGGLVWSFPATPVWEFTEEKAEAATRWIEHLQARLLGYREEYGEQPWPQELSQCQTPWGLCGFYGDCFKPKMDLAELMSEGKGTK